MRAGINKFRRKDSLEGGLLPHRHQQHLGRPQARKPQQLPAQPRRLADLPRAARLRKGRRTSQTACCPERQRPVTERDR